MSNFVRKRLRCELSPARTPDTPFTSKTTGAPPQAVKAAGVEFELCIFDENDSAGNAVLFDISNIASVTVQITDSGGGVKAARTVTRLPSAIGSLNPGCTLDQWNAGQAQHVLCIFSASDMNFAAGSYKVQVYGFTDDDTGDNDAFGLADLTLADMFLNAGAAAPTGKTSVYVDDLAGILAGVARVVNDQGVTITLISPDGTKRRTIGVDNDGNPTD